MRLRSPEFLWAVSRWLYRGGWSRSARAVKTVNYCLHKCLLPAEAKVGRNINLEHYALGIVLHPQVEIGDDCQIYHHVTLAAESVIGSNNKIILGNRVVIGAHAIVVARPNTTLRIGAGSIVGAGAVVLRDILPGEIWAGNPARKIKTVAERVILG